MASAYIDQILQAFVTEPLGSSLATEPSDKQVGMIEPLTDREQEIMVRFAQSAGETIPRHEMFAESAGIGERTIDVQINRLRRKIEADPANPRYFQTVRGIRYRLSTE